MPTKTTAETPAALPQWSAAIEHPDGTPVTDEPTALAIAAALVGSTAVEADDPESGIWLVNTDTRQNAAWLAAMEQSGLYIEEAGSAGTVRIEAEAV